MLPYIELHTIQLGPLTIQVWGLMVALGILLGTFVSARKGRMLGFDKHIWEAAPWVVIAAFLGARIFHVLFYDPGHYLKFPLEAINPFLPGFSMIGGMLGAALAFIAYQRKSKLPFLKFADAGIFGLPFGIWIGRIGCALIHDHPGIETAFFLGIRYPDGVVRHDLGFYDSLVGLSIGVVFLVAVRKPRRDGFYLYLFMILYGLARLGLDFLRLVDVRYLWLTPSQWVSVVLVISAILLLTKKSGENIVK